MSYKSYYLKQLYNYNILNFLRKYLCSPSLIRLKHIGFFCGMDYASKNIYNFREYISRYHHSVACALLTYKYTNEKASTLAALFHDVGTPCFSHVIDFMNSDYEDQESTEQYHERTILKDSYLLSCLNADNINVDDIINFKKFSIVDNKRPKLCIDRLDGIILSDIGWSKLLDKQEIKNTINDITIFQNEENELELGFKTLSICKRILEVNKYLNELCHSNEDKYMMDFLAQITKKAIEKGIITYEELFFSTEIKLYNKIKNADLKFKLALEEFKNIDVKDIPKIEIPRLKIRTINPLINGKRVF